MIEDKLPGDFISSMEQLVAATFQIAEAISTYYKELIKGGVPETTAAALTLEYQNTLLRGMK